VRKEDFFEVLGNLDDDIVKGAKTPMEKQFSWKIWGTMAACLVLVCMLTIHFISLNNDGEATSQGVADVAPMVYVNDTLYIQSSDQRGYSELKDEFVYLGKIESTTSEEGAPKKNFQANHLVIGCEVYQYGENIVVHINDAYWLYMKYGEPEVNWDDLTEQEKQNLDPTYKG